MGRQSDERLAKTERMIREAICQGRDTLLLVLVSIRDNFPDVRWQTMLTMGGPVAEVRRLHVTVASDWLETVGEPGLTMVENHLVIQAEPTSPMNTPPGCEGSWTVLASDCQAGKYKFKEGGPAPRLAFVVKYGGLLAIDQNPPIALARLMRQFEHGLGLPVSGRHPVDFEGEF